MNLEQLLSGKSAIIKSINGESNIKKRLLLLGFSTGKRVVMIKSAPLRDPLEISLDNGHLSIRRKEASLIEIEEENGRVDE